MANGRFILPEIRETAIFHVYPVLPTAVLGFNLLTRHKLPYLLRIHLPIYWRSYWSGIWKCFCSSEIIVFFLPLIFLTASSGLSRSKEERLMRRPSPSTCLSVYKQCLEFFSFEIQRELFTKRFRWRLGFIKDGSLRLMMYLGV